MNEININFRDKDLITVDENTKIKDIVNKYQKYFNYDILAAKVDNDISDLSDKLNRDCKIDFVDRSTSPGNNIYLRSLKLIMILAVKRVLGTKADVKVENSIDRGIYCEILNKTIDKPILKRIEDEMNKIVKEDLLYTKLSVSRIDAISFFKKKNQEDKCNLLKYISNTYINLYRLDNVYDYFFGEMAYSTKSINDFKLTYIKNNGFVLSYPSLDMPEVTLDYVHQNMVFDTFNDYTSWGRKIGVNNAPDLNKIISSGEYDKLIHLAEANYNSQLSEASNKIFENKKNIKLVLIAGPSSSGKTTTSKKLDIYLQSMGLNTHQISIDDYFLDKKDTPLDEHGDYDFESLRAIDTELFNKNLIDLLDGKEIILPKYNFILGKREFYKKPLKIDNNDIIIIEGLHALNDELTSSIMKKNKFKIYISPLTQLNLDNHSRIHTSDTRKFRRIIRDHKHRGYSASDTLLQWKKIKEGETKYIFPFQNTADMIINSALIYELSVLKVYAEPLLFSVNEDDPAYPEAIRLINLLRNILPMPSDTVPKESVLREFIGGSCFE